MRSPTRRRRAEHVQRHRRERPARLVHIDGDVMDTIQSITMIVDAFRKAREVAKHAADADVQQILLDAQDRALTLKEQVLELREENLRLRQQVQAKAAVTFDQGAYFTNTETGRDGPFCTRCWDVSRTLVRMKQNFEYWHRCPECDKAFEVKSLPPRPHEPTRVVRG